jgi:hypothetical protein
MAKVNEFWNGIDKKENSIKDRGLSTAPASLTDSQRRRERVSVNKSNQKIINQEPVERSYNENGRYYNQDDVLLSNRVQHIPGYSGHIQRTPDSIGLSTFGEKTPNNEGTTYKTEFNASLPLPSFQAVEVERKQMKRDELLDSLQKHSVARTKPSKLTNNTSGEPSGLVRKYHMKSPVKTSQKTASHHIVGYTGHQSTSSDAYLNYSLPTRHGE